MRTRLELSPGGRKHSTYGGRRSRGNGWGLRNPGSSIRALAGVGASPGRADVGSDTLPCPRRQGQQQVAASPGTCFPFCKSVIKHPTSEVAVSIKEINTQK